jgi:hypothetical protein
MLANGANFSLTDSSRPDSLADVASNHASRCWFRVMAHAARDDSPAREDQRARFVRHAPDQRGQRPASRRQGRGPHRVADRPSHGAQAVCARSADSPRVQGPDTARRPYPRYLGDRQEPNLDRAAAVEGDTLPQLDRIRRDLGLPDDCRLRAELHNLLVYEPGQFFVTHQDSEKADDMIGTLVVILPSDFTGGAMVLEHHDEKVIFRSSGGKLSFIAFYADCHHEIRRIKQGYRVVLTYNLILDGAATASVVSPTDQIDALARCVSDFFETPPAPRWRNEPLRDSPDRIVYLLDHQYTRRGLAWTRLKNADATRAKSPHCTCG